MREMWHETHGDESRDASEEVKRNRALQLAQPASCEVSSLESLTALTAHNPGKVSALLTP